MRSVIFIPLLFLIFIIYKPTEASFLCILSPAGTNASNSFSDNFSENEFDLTRPAFLLNEKKKKFIF